MAYGQFESYAPVEGQSDAYDFSLANGKSLRLNGDVANDLVNKIDLSQASTDAAKAKSRLDLATQKDPQPQPVALNDASSGGDAGVSLASGGREDPSTGMSLQEAPVAKADVASPNPSVQLPGPRDADTSLSAPTAVPQPAPQAVPVARTKTGGIIVRAPNGVLYEHSPGSAGISKSQLQARAANSVALPVGESESVEGGFDPSADYLEQRANASIDKKLAINQLSDAQQAENQAIHDSQAKQLAQQASNQEQDLKAQQEVQAGVKQDQADLTKAVNEYKSAKVDPARMFAGTGGTFRLFGAAIAAALGQYGATLAHGQNGAQQIIQSAIERDVRSQEAEISIKGKNADNALSRLQTSMGSMDKAKTALRVSQLEYAKTQAAEVASRYHGQTIAASAQATIAGLDDSLAKEQEDYRIASQGRHTASVTKRFAAPQAGSRARDLPLTIEQSKEIGEAGKTSAETNKLNAEADKARGLVTGGDVPKAYKQADAAADSVLRTSDKVMQAYGVDPKKPIGYWEGKKLEASLVADPAKARKVEVLFPSIQTEFYKLISPGSSPSDIDKKEFEDQQKNWSTAKKIEFIQQATQMAREKQKFFRSGKITEEGGSPEDFGATEE